MDKIIDNLYLGSHADISQEYLDHYKIDVVICVLEEPHCLKRNEDDGRDWIHIPIMHYAEEGEPIYDEQDYGEHADPENLDRVAHIINGALRLKKNVLVHCGAGLERSPLAVAWYLSTKKHITFNQAYDIINKSRKVYNRISWLPPEYRKDW